MIEFSEVFVAYLDFIFRKVFSMLLGYTETSMEKRNSSIEDSTALVFYRKKNTRAMFFLERIMFVDEYFYFFSVDDKFFVLK